MALFSGLREVKHDRSTTIRADEEAWSDYRLTLGKHFFYNIWFWALNSNIGSLISPTDSSIDLDVPIELTSLDKYCATLGHKACHSFSKRNARFENLWHPRLYDYWGWNCRYYHKTLDVVITDLDGSWALLPWVIFLKGLKYWSSMDTTWESHPNGTNNSMKILNKD